MAGTSTTDFLGPVDVAVIAFEGNHVNSDVAPALIELQNTGTVRIIDATMVSKDSSGGVSTVELADSEVAEAFERLTERQLDLLSESDLRGIAAGLKDDCSALVIVWENTWAARLATAIRDSQGEVVELDRIPRDVVLAAFAALDEPAGT